MECECPNWRITKRCSHASTFAETEEGTGSYVACYGKQTLANKRNQTNAAQLNFKKSNLGNKGKRSKKATIRQTHLSPANSKNTGDSAPGVVNVNGSRTLKHLRTTASAIRILQITLFWQ